MFIWSNDIHTFVKYLIKAASESFFYKQQSSKQYHKFYTGHKGHKFYYMFIHLSISIP